MNADQASQASSADITMRPIGRVHSPFVSTVGMPIQTVAATEHCGQIEIFAHGHLDILAHRQRREERAVLEENAEDFVRAYVQKGGQ